MQVKSKKHLSQWLSTCKQELQLKADVIFATMQYIYAYIGDDNNLKINDILLGTHL